MSTRIVLSLISHTNIGKTTLARTLLRQDIGEVRDEAHVTDESSQHTLIETPEAALILWDTPGFGNVSHLLKRLKQEQGGWGWLLHQVVDRVFNRSLYASYEATKNVRSESDVVLYLVNVREEPEDAGYASLELQLLEALAKPVIMILNQLEGDHLADREQRAELVEKWRRAFSSFACVKQVLVLDAFTRSWHQELRLFEVIRPLLEPRRAKALDNLRKKYLERQETTFRACAEKAAETLWFAASQQVPPSEDQHAKAMFEALVGGLQTRLDAYLDLLVDQHGIQSVGRAKFDADVKLASGLTTQKMSEQKSGLWAGALSSAGSGLAADLLSGGLTFGGGALLGFLGGYFGGSTYAKFMNLRKRGQVTWKKDALLQLFKLLIGYYLIAAHHGRGKGKLVLEEPVTFISDALEQVWPDQETNASMLLERVKNQIKPDDVFLDQATAIVQSSAERVLGLLYPGGQEGTTQEQE